VAATDVAGFATAAVGHLAAEDQTIVIGGPEPISWRDVVALAEEVVRRPIPVRMVASGEPIPSLPPLIVGLLTAQDTYDSPIDMTETARAFGVHLTSPAAFIQRLLGG
jgi:NADH dehydrogenase